MSGKTPIWADSKLAAEFWRLGRSPSCPIIDVHGHMGPFRGIYLPRAQPAQMIRSMDAAGVRLLCFAHHAGLLAPDVGHGPAVEAVRAFPDRFRAYLAINPNYPEIVERDLAAFDGLRDVYVGLKFLGSYHGVPITDDRYRAALQFAEDRSLPVLLHTWGGNAFNGAPHVRQLAQDYPNVRFLLGHCLYGQWDEAAAIANDLPNTHLELCAVLGLRGRVEFFVERVGSGRLLYGTDLPWFDEHQAIGSLLAADVTDEDRHDILHRNAEKLLGL